MLTIDEKKVGGIHRVTDKSVSRKDYVRAMLATAEPQVFAMHQIVKQST